VRTSTTERARPAWTPDGRHLIVPTATGAFLLDMSGRDWTAAACAVAGRNLTKAEWSQYLPGGEPYRATCPQYPLRTAPPFSP